MRLFAWSHTASHNLQMELLNPDPNCPPAFSHHCKGSPTAIQEWSETQGSLSHSLQIQSDFEAPLQPFIQQKGHTGARVPHIVFVILNGRALPLNVIINVLMVFSFLL